MGREIFSPLNAIAEMRKCIHISHEHDYDFNSCYDEMLNNLSRIREKYNIGINERIILMDQDEYLYHLEKGTISEFIIVAELM